MDAGQNNKHRIDKNVKVLVVVWSKNVGLSPYSA